MIRMAMQRLDGPTACGDVLTVGVQCDGCGLRGASGPPEVSPSVLRRALRGKGWTLARQVGPYVRDYCPECKGPKIGA